MNPRANPGYPHHVVVLFRQNFSDPTPECRRAAPDFHHYIEHRTCHHRNELPLAPLYQVMQSTKNVSRRAALVVLKEASRRCLRLRIYAAAGTRRNTPGIAEHIGLNEHDAGNLGRVEFHGCLTSRARPQAGRRHIRSWPTAARAARVARHLYSPSGTRSLPGNSL